MPALGAVLVKWRVSERDLPKFHSVATNVGRLVGQHPISLIPKFYHRTSADTPSASTPSDKGFSKRSERGRVCLGMELEARYVDVAVLRWQAFTGMKACLFGDGRSFEAVAGERLTGLQNTNPSPAPDTAVETAVNNDPAAA